MPPALMKRVFITELDTPVARRLCELFQRTKEYEVVGTLRPTLTSGRSGESSPQRSPRTITTVPLPPNVQAIVPRYIDDAAAFKAAVLDSDVIICTLKDSIVEAESAIKMLMNTPSELERNFVLVSSVMTWADTYRAQVAEEAAERARERQALIDAGEDVPPEEPPAEPEEKPVFSEDMYAKRVPHRRYQHWRNVEHLAKLASSETLHTNVVFAGLPYGRGEDVLHDLFRSAWHGQALPLYGPTTDNNVPMIHLDDLASLVFKIGSSSDVIATKYLFAVDRGNVTQKQISTTINESIGVGAVRVVTPSQAAVDMASEWLSFDLSITPGACFEILEETDWVAPEGFVATFERVVDEYRVARKLQPVKVVLQGAPQSGKTTLGRQLAYKYRAPLLGIQDIMESYEQNLHSLREKLEAMREAKRQEKARAVAEAARLAAEEAKAQQESEDAAKQADGGDGDGGKDGADGDGDAGSGVDVHSGTGNAAGEGDPQESSLRGNNASLRDDDDVSDISFDDIPTLRDLTTPDPGSEAAAEAAAAPADAGDEDEDEAMTKLKEEIALTEKVLQMKKQFGGAPPKEPVEGDEAAAEAEAAAQQQDESSMIKSPSPNENTSTSGDAAAANNSEGGAAVDPSLPPMSMRFIDEALATMTRWRLSQCDCRNYGYVLDGFPKTVRQAALTFAAGGEPPALPELEEIISNRYAGPAEILAAPTAEAEEGALNPCDEQLLPSYSVLLDTEGEALLVTRAASHGDADLHNSLHNWRRRYLNYTTHHSLTGRAAVSLRNWWTSAVTASTMPEGAGPTAFGKLPRTVSAVTVDAARLAFENEAVLEYLGHALGEPRFYRPTVREYIEAQANEEKREAEEARRLEKELAEANAIRQAREQAEARQEAVQQRRLTSVATERVEGQKAAQLGMQEYLMSLVMPAVTTGVEQVVKERPEDPIDALAEYLYAYKARLHL